jgi:tRNA threonylcarbamoyladenosine biosynthesis protein TsaE
MENGKLKVICKDLGDTAKLAQKFAAAVKDGAFVNLYGEIGAGKTAFVKLVADALEVKEKVTSPSFVILNEYHTGSIPIYHFDLYRLENEGVGTILDELHEYSEGKNVTFVEWAEFSRGEIPFNHIKINVTYAEDDSRVYSFESSGMDAVLEGIK